MSEVRAVATGPVLDAGDTALAFSVPGIMWSLDVGEDEFEGPSRPGLLLALAEDIRGTIETRSPGLRVPRRFRALNVFDVDCLAEPALDDSLIDGVRVQAGAGVPIYGAYRELFDARARRSAVSALRESLQLPPPVAVRFLMKLPPERRAAILRHYPVEVDMAEHALWEAIDDSVNLIDG